MQCAPLLLHLAKQFPKLPAPAFPCVNNGGRRYAEQQEKLLYKLYSQEEH